MSRNRNNSIVIARPALAGRGDPDLPGDKRAYAWYHQPDFMAKAAKKYFVIVDGHALLHRAWHALPPLTTSKGEIVHGAYGFTTILLGAIKKFSPACIAVTFDLKAPTFRHEQYEQYKATREKKPDELYAQVAVIERILDAMGIPVFTAQGFEADDVIGTLSRLAAEQDPDAETVIVTGDLDTLQLVDERTRVFTLRKGMTDTVLYDAKAVRERFGLRPDQLVDYKALRGDPSDNIPGVRGIGEKTGADLISTFGTLEALYEAVDKGSKKAAALKPAVVEKLKTHRKDAFIAQDLCRIRRDVPLDFTFAACAHRPITRERVASIFTELEFMKLLNQIPKGESEPEAAVPEATISLFSAQKEVGEDQQEITDVKTMRKALEALAKERMVAFRTVSDDNDPIAPSIAALGLKGSGTPYVVRKKVVRECVELLREFFSSGNEKVCHDLKREHKALAGLGVSIASPRFDLMIASYLLHSGERRHSLGSILAYRRGVPIEDDEPSVEQRVARLGIELTHIRSLSEEYRLELAALKLDRINATVEIPLAGVLARIEAAGVAVDVPYFKELSKEVGASISKLTKRIYKLAGEEFNVNSPMQLKVVLFEKLGISPKGLRKTEKGKTLSTAASELEKLRGEHPIIDAILDYRELAKLQSTYIDALPALVHPKTGRIHAEFNQTVTATGRLSGANPNLQNIPTSETEYGKRVRNGFVAPRGTVLVAADYSQIELRIAAHIAKEKEMVRAFREGEDIHWRTAVEMWGEAEAANKRRIAKVINFGILYGMGAQRLAESASLSFTEAREYIDRYFAIHPGIAAYMDEIKVKIVTDGYVETLFGRKRFFKNVHLMNPRERAEAERQAINMPIQGTQADMIKLAMVRLDERIAEKYGAGADADVKMIMQVHDELVFEVKKDLAEKFAGEVLPLMTDVVSLSVPVAVNVSIGKRWGEMEKVK